VCELFLFYLRGVLLYDAICAVRSLRAECVDVVFSIWDLRTDGLATVAKNTKTKNQSFEK